jgi:hypothetical protein
VEEAYLKKDPLAEVDRHVRKIKEKAPGAPPDEMKTLAETLQDFIEARRLFVDRLKFYAGRYNAASGTPGGFGRTDAWGTVRNMVYDNQSRATAPTDYPHLWGFEKDKYLHWIGNTGSVMRRNIGQALGLTAIFESRAYTSTVDVENLDRLETLAYKIVPPRWSDTDLPPLDERKREAGEAIYMKRCSGCHDKMKEDNGFHDLVMTPLEKVGTDPAQVENFLKPVKVNGAEVPFITALSGLLTKVQEKAYADANVSEDKAKAWEHGRGWIDPLWRDPSGYVARPLAGVWATAPYLHNGSVPTLDALLRPSADPRAAVGPTKAAGSPPASPIKLRPTRFGIGVREYDPKKVGYANTDDPRYTFDLGAPGNKNSGHEGKAYGTDISDEQREALLEYLKSL